MATTDGIDPPHADGVAGAAGVEGAEGTDAALLAATVLAEEARRQEASAPRPEVVLPDDLLPGVGAESMSLASALRVGGVGPDDRVGEHVRALRRTRRGLSAAATGDEQRGGQGRRAASPDPPVDHPFRPLRDTPWMMCRWASTNRISTGTLASTAPAMITG